MTDVVSAPALMSNRTTRLREAPPNTENQRRVTVTVTVVDVCMHVQRHLFPRCTATARDT